jgi:hypothetical protein
MEEGADRVAIGRRREVERVGAAVAQRRLDAEVGAGVLADDEHPAQRGDAIAQRVRLGPAVLVELRLGDDEDGGARRVEQVGEGVDVEQVVERARHARHLRAEQQGGQARQGRRQERDDAFRGRDAERAEQVRRARDLGEQLAVGERDADVVRVLGAQHGQRLALAAVQRGGAEHVEQVARGDELVVRARLDRLDVLDAAHRADRPCGFQRAFHRRLARSAQRRRQALLEQALGDLAVEVARQRLGADGPGLGHGVVGDARGAEGLQGGGARLLADRAHADEGVHALAEHRAGNADERRLDHLRMLGKHVLDRGAVDLEAAAVDHVLLRSSTRT